MPGKNKYIKIFRAFTDESRLRVLELLCGGEKCACILLEDLQISQSTLSHHMKILCDSGIVTSRPVGKWSYYSINDSGCLYAKEFLTKLIERDPAGMSCVAQIFYRLLFSSKYASRILRVARLLINSELPVASLKPVSDCRGAAAKLCCSEIGSAPLPGVTN